MPDYSLVLRCTDTEQFMDEVRNIPQLLRMHRLWQKEHNDDECVAENVEECFQIMLQQLVFYAFDDRHLRQLVDVVLPCLADTEIRDFVLFKTCCAPIGSTHFEKAHRPIYERVRQIVRRVSGAASSDDRLLLRRSTHHVPASHAVH
jgi:hypothetical protein